MRRHRSECRRGVAVTECALAIPLMLLLAFATLEICSVLHVRQTLKTIAFEGARTGVRRQATRSDAEAICNRLLTDRNVTGGTCTVTPNDFSTLQALDPITVTVSAPLAGNSWFIYQFIGPSTLQTSVRMVREFDE